MNRTAITITAVGALALVPAIASAHHGAAVCDVPAGQIVWSFDEFKARDYPITLTVNGQPSWTINQGEPLTRALPIAPGVEVVADATWPTKANGGEFTPFVGVCGTLPPPPPTPPATPPSPVASPTPVPPEVVPPRRTRPRLPVRPDRPRQRIVVNKVMPARTFPFVPYRVGITVRNRSAVPVAVTILDILPRGVIEGKTKSGDWGATRLGRKVVLRARGGSYTWRPLVRNTRAAINRTVCNDVIAVGRGGGFDRDRDCTYDPQR